MDDTHPGLVNGLPSVEVRNVIWRRCHWRPLRINRFIKVCLQMQPQRRFASSSSESTSLKTGTIDMRSPSMNATGFGASYRTASCSASSLVAATFHDPFIRSLCFLGQRCRELCGLKFLSNLLCLREGDLELGQFRVRMRRFDSLLWVWVQESSLVPSPPPFPSRS